MCVLLGNHEAHRGLLSPNEERDNEARLISRLWEERDNEARLISRLWEKWA